VIIPKEVAVNRLSDNDSADLSRRRFLANTSALGTASFLGLSRTAAAEPPPEITTLRLTSLPVACIAPQFVAEPLLKRGSLMYRVNLGGGIAPSTLELDHKVFSAGNDYFVAFAVPQLEAAIEKLRPH